MHGERGETAKWGECELCHSPGCVRPPWLHVELARPDIQNMCIVYMAKLAVSDGRYEKWHKKHDTNTARHDRLSVNASMPRA